MRCEERSAERAASPWSPCSESASSSRFASTLVSGVRSSCEASATNWRWRASIASVSSRAASSSRSMPSSVRASSATSSSAGGWGMPREGSRVRAISAAVEVSCGDRRHRAARDRHARGEREQAAGEHAEHQEQLDALDRRLGGRDLAPVLDEDLPDRLAGVAQSHDRRAADHAVAVDRVADVGERRRRATALRCGFLADQLAGRA